MIGVFWDHFVVRERGTWLSDADLSTSFFLILSLLLDHQWIYETKSGNVDTSTHTETLHCSCCSQYVKMSEMLKPVDLLLVVENGNWFYGIYGHILIWNILLNADHIRTYQLFFWLNVTSCFYPFASNYFYTCSCELVLQTIYNDCAQDCWVNLIYYTIRTLTWFTQVQLNWLSQGSGELETSNHLHCVAYRLYSL